MTIKETRTDEELLLASRLGDLYAEQVLAQRFFRRRFGACKAALPDAMSQLDDWQLNEAHFHAYLLATTTFEFKGGKLFTYYVTVLSHELLHIVTRVSKERQRMSFVDFEAPMDLDRYNDFCLADATPSGEELDDPQAFYRYAETLKKLEKLPRGISPITLDLVRLLREGYTLTEAAPILQIKRDKAKYEIKKYRAWAMKVFRNMDADETKLEEKEKLLDRFLWGSGEGGVGVP